MKVENTYPPNYREIVGALGACDTAIYCYGDTIYNPHNREIKPDIAVHEAVHSKQQEKMGVDTWYQLYLADPQFRLSQEIDAYAAQHVFAMKMFDGGQRELLEWGLENMARALSSEAYGSIISFDEAVHKIRHTAEKVV